MRVNSKWLAVLLILASIPLTGCGFVQKLRARDYSNKGVKMFGDQKYDAAVQYFEKAIQEDPKFDEARMYLAYSYMSQFVPGSTDPKSEEMAMKAVDTFKSVADNAAKKENRINSMLACANLYYQLKRADESKDWCNRILKIDPNNAEAYYRIAVVDYDNAFDMTGMQGENVEYMTPEEKAAVQKSIEEGLSCLDKAMERRANYFDAMEYQNLLWREKAKFETDEQVKAELIRKADLLSQKAVALKLKAEEEEAKKPKKLGTIGAGR